MAISGDTVVAGAPYDSGSAYIFRMTDGGASVEVFKLTASDAAANDFFGHSVAIDGNNIVIGAPYNNDAGSYSIGLRLPYDRRRRTCGQVANLTASDAAAGDKFGWSVAIDGSTVVVGPTGTRSFVYVGQSMSWSDAQALPRELLRPCVYPQCQRMRKSSRFVPNLCWIGGSDSAQEGTWTWSDGTRGTTRTGIPISP